MPAQRHGGAHGGKADDTGAYPRDRPREAKLLSLWNGSQRRVCGCPRFGKKIFLTAVCERGILSVVCQASRCGLISHGPGCSSKNRGHIGSENFSLERRDWFNPILNIEVLSASFRQSIFLPGILATGISALPLEKGSRLRHSVILLAPRGFSTESSRRREEYSAFSECCHHLPISSLLRSDGC